MSNSSGPRQSQQWFIEQCKRDSFLDRSVAFGTPHSVPAEIGLSAFQHFDRRRRLGDFGRHWFSTRWRSSFREIERADGRMICGPTTLPHSVATHAGA
jgi:hypothetical protein